MLADDGGRLFSRSEPNPEQVQQARSNGLLDNLVGKSLQF
jgi:hypothetical protein